MVKELLASLVVSNSRCAAHFQKLLGALSSFEQRNVIYSVLKVLSTEYLSSSITTEDNAEWWQSDATIVSAAASIVTLLTAQAENRKDHLILWLTSSSGAGVGEGIAIRRAVVASIAANKSDIELVLDKCLSQFGDKLYINHTPTLQQEGMSPIIIYISAKLIMFFSSCTSSSLDCRIFTSVGAPTSDYDDEIWKPSRRSLESTGSLVSPCSISRHGCGGGTFRSCRQRRQETGFQGR